MKYDLTFSVNLHDNDGDVYEEGILIHLGNGTILQFSDFNNYERFIKDLDGMRTEIKRNYYEDK